MLKIKLLKEHWIVFQFYVIHKTHIVQKGEKKVFFFLLGLDEIFFLVYHYFKIFC